MYVILFQKVFLLNCYFEVDSSTVYLFLWHCVRRMKIFIIKFDFSKVYITISVHVLVDTLLNYFNQITIL